MRLHVHIYYSAKVVEKDVWVGAHYTMVHTTSALNLPPTRLLSGVKIINFVKIVPNWKSVQLTRRKSLIKQ